jgi:hypothetical protein
MPFQVRGVRKSLEQGRLPGTNSLGAFGSQAWAIGMGSGVAPPRNHSQSWPATRLSALEQEETPDNAQPAIGESRAYQEGHVATRAGHAGTEITTERSRADHQDTHDGVLPSEYLAFMMALSAISFLSPVHPETLGER